MNERLPADDVAMKAAFDLTCSDFPGACCDSCHDDENWFDYALADGRVARICCFKLRTLKAHSDGGDATN